MSLLNKRGKAVMVVDRPQLVTDTDTMFSVDLWSDLDHKPKSIDSYIHPHFKYE